MEKIAELTFEELENVNGGMGGEWGLCDRCNKPTQKSSLEKYGGICRTCNSGNTPGGSP